MNPRHTLRAERLRRRRPLLFHPGPVCRGHRTRRAADQAADVCRDWEVSR